MAHGRIGPDIVMTTRYVGVSEIRSVSEHELNRTPDGSSAIDPLRSHLNQVLHGPRTQTEAVAQMWSSGVRPPAKQAERPFVQMVLSASPEFFRRDGLGPGEWDEDALASWLERTMTWLRQEYGDDLAHVSLHLDEDTPHVHVLVIPTYEKAARKPGRPKRGESIEDFEARKSAVVEQGTTRTAGRASSPYWSRPFARRDARKSYYAAVQPLGLGYGRDFVGERDGDKPQPKTTGKWVREQAAALRDREIALDRREADLARREAETSKISLKAAAVVAGAEALAVEIAAGTVRRDVAGKIKLSNVAVIRPALPELAPAIRAAADAQAKLDADRVEVDRKSEEIGRAHKVLDRVAGWMARRFKVQLPAGLWDALDVLENAARPRVRIAASEPAQEPSVAAQEPVEAPDEPEPEDSGPGF